MGNFLSSEDDCEILGCLYFCHSRYVVHSFLLPFYECFGFDSSQLTNESKLCHVNNMYAVMSKGHQYRAYISILLSKNLPVKKTLYICVIILKCVQYVLIYQENFPDVPESRRAALPLVLVTDLHRTAPVRW